MPEKKVNEKNRSTVEGIIRKYSGTLNSTPSVKMNRVSNGNVAERTYTEPVIEKNRLMNVAKNIKQPSTPVMRKSVIEPVPQRAPKLAEPVTGRRAPVEKQLPSVQPEPVYRVGGQPAKPKQNADLYNAGDERKPVVPDAMQTGTDTKPQLPTVNPGAFKEAKMLEPTVPVDLMSEQADRNANHLEAAEKIKSIPGVTAVDKKQDPEFLASFAESLDQLEGAGYLTPDGRANIEAMLDAGDYEGAQTALYTCYDDGNRGHAIELMNGGNWTQEQHDTLQADIDAGDWDSFTHHYNTFAAQQPDTELDDLKARMVSGDTQAGDEWSSTYLNKLGAIHYDKSEIDAAKAKQDELYELVSVDGNTLIGEDPLVVASYVINGRIELPPEAMDEFYAAYDKANDPNDPMFGDYTDCVKIVEKNWEPWVNYDNQYNEWAHMRDSEAAYVYFNDGVETFRNYIEKFGGEYNTDVNDQEENPIYRAVNGLPPLVNGQESSDSTAYSQTDWFWMTDEMKAIYNTIYNTEGLDAANAFADSTRWMAMANRTEHDKAYTEQLIAEGGTGAVIAENAAAVLEFVLNIPAAANTIFRTAFGKYVDTNAGIYGGMHHRNTTMSATYQKIVDKGHPVGGVLYNMFMSAMDAASMVGLQFLGVPSWMTGVSFFSAEFNDSYQYAVDAGLDKVTSMYYGMGKGFIGALAEKYSLEQIINLPALGGKGWEAFVAMIRNIATSMVTEGSEEGVEDVVGWLWDAMALGDKSPFRQSVEKYMADGDDEQTAYSKAIGDSFLDFCMDVAGGSFAGGLLAIPTTAINTVRSAKATRLCESKGKSVRANNEVEFVSALNVMTGGDTSVDVNALSDEQLGALAYAESAKVAQFLISEDEGVQMAAEILTCGETLNVQQAEAILQVAPEVAESFGLPTEYAAALATAVNDRVGSISTEAMPSVEGGKVTEAAKTNPLTERTLTAANQVQQTLDVDTNADTNATAANQAETAEQAQSVAEETQAQNGTDTQATEDMSYEAPVEKGPEQAYELTQDDAVEALMQDDISEDEVSEIVSSLVLQGEEQGKAREKALASLKEKRTKARESVLDSLNKMEKMLTSTKKGHNYHVPEGMISSIADVCSKVKEFMTSPRTGAGMAKLQEALNLFESIANANRNTDSNVPTMFGDILTNRVTELNNVLRDKTSSRSLNTAEMFELSEIMAGINHAVRCENAYVGMEMHQTIQEDANALAEQSAEYGVTIDKSGGVTNKAKAMETLRKSMVTMYGLGESPMRLARLMTKYNDDAVLPRLFRMMNDGEIKAKDIKRDCILAYTDTLGTEAKNAEKLGGAKAEWTTLEVEVPDETGTMTKRTITDVNGNPVRISPEMKVAIVLNALCENNRLTMMDGGLIIPNEKDYKAGKLAAAFTEDTQHVVLTQPEITSIIASLNPTERAMLEAYQACKKVQTNALNDAYRTVYGFNIATVDNHFHKATNSNFRGATNADIFTMDEIRTSLDSWGALKQRTGDTRTPINLMEVVDVMNSEVPHVSDIAGKLAAVRNVGMVLGAKSEVNGMTGYGSIGKNYGQKTSAIIRSICDDYAGKTRTKNDVASSAMNKVISKGVNAIFYGKFDTMVKQAGSFFTAGTVTDMESVFWALKEMALGKFSKKHRAPSVDELSRMSGLFFDRTLGGSLTGYEGKKGRNSSGVWGAIRNAPVLSDGMTRVDIATVRNLYLVAEHYVQKSMSVDDPGYREAVVNKFNQIIQDTQPTQTTMQKGELLRSQNSLLRSVFAFKTQMFNQGGALADALNEFAFKHDKASGIKAANAVGSFITSATFIAAVNAAFRMLKGKVNDYRDEDDGTLDWGKVASVAGRDVIDNLFGSYMFGSELLTVIDKAMKKNPRDTSILLLDIINDGVDTVGSISSLIDKLTPNEDGEIEAGYEDILSFLKKNSGTLSNFTGIGVENLVNYASGLYSDVVDLFSGDFGRFVHSDPKYSGPEYKAFKGVGLEWSDFTHYKTAFKTGKAEEHRAALMENPNLTPEQRATIDACVIVGKNYKTEGGKVYSQKDNGEWVLKADYTSDAWFTLSTMTTSCNNNTPYNTVKAAVSAGICMDENDGLNLWNAFMGARKGSSLSKTAFESVCTSWHLTPEQKKWWGKKLIKNYAAD